jgi:hypothetical protein
VLLQQPHDDTVGAGDRLDAVDDRLQHVGEVQAAADLLDHPQDRPQPGGLFVDVLLPVRGDPPGLDQRRRHGVEALGDLPQLAGPGRHHLLLQLALAHGVQRGRQDADGIQTGAPQRPAPVRRGGQDEQPGQGRAAAGAEQCGVLGPAPLVENGRRPLAERRLRGAVLVEERLSGQQELDLLGGPRRVGPIVPQRRFGPAVRPAALRQVDVEHALGERRLGGERHQIRLGGGEDLAAVLVGTQELRVTGSEEAPDGERLVQRAGVVGLQGDESVLGPAHRGARHQHQPREQAHREKHDEPGAGDHEPEAVVHHGAQAGNGASPHHPRKRPAALRDSPGHHRHPRPENPYPPSSACGPVRLSRRSGVGPDPAVPESPGGGYSTEMSIAQTLTRTAAAAGGTGPGTWPSAAAASLICRRSSTPLSSHEIPKATVQTSSTISRIV